MEEMNVYTNLLKYDRYYKIVDAKFKQTAVVIDKYVFNIKLSAKNELIYEIYAEENPTNLFYKLKLTFEQLKNMHPIFKSKKDISEIYDIINSVVNQNGYEIKYENFSNANIIMTLFIDKKGVKFTLPKEKVTFEPNYYELAQLYNECLMENENLVNYINQKEKEIEELKKQIKKVKKDQIIYTLKY